MAQLFPIQAKKSTLVSGNQPGEFFFKKQTNKRIQKKQKN